MKKLIAMLLALTMVFSFATVAFADDETPETPAEKVVNMKSQEVAASVTIEKMYEVTGSTDQALYPTETLKFKSVPKSTNPDTTNLKLADLVVSGNKNQKLNITLPEYTVAGVYEYDISEDATSNVANQGVTYSDAVISVKVLVSYDYDDTDSDTYGLETEIVLITKDVEDDSKNNLEDAEGVDKGKVDTFVNKYDVGHLTVAKTVEGNLASETQYFDFTVAFTSTKPVASKITVSGGSEKDTVADTSIEITDWTEKDGTYTYTHSFKLKHGETLTFNNIPDGVTYVVKEDAKHKAGNTFDPNSASDKDYTVTYTNDTGAIETNTTTAASVKNYKNTTVETGITLDSMPYVLMLVIACAGVVLFVGKKRHED